jgi:predicted  nucleic acid-binding Zn-ribbon protein
MDVARALTETRALTEKRAHRDVNAPPISSPEQLRLLDLQAVDTALAQLRHRRATLPELAAITQRAAEAAELETALVEVQTSVGDIATEQRRLENDVDAVQTRAGRDEQRLQTGGLPAKELESLQHEIATLSRRKSVLEDELIDVMERREQAESTSAELTGRRDALAALRAELEAARDTAFAEIDEATAQRCTERDAVAAEIPADLLAIYERAREHSGGVGAAMLRQRRCEGCHIELAGSELTAVRAAAPETVVRCDNCRRILVRTPESGL